MTIDEEIQRQEEQAMAYKSMGNLLSMNMSTEKQFRAAEDYRMSDYHKQLAKWLKELKAFRSGINCSTCKYREVDGIDHPCIYCHPSDNRWEYGGAEE